MPGTASLDFSKVELYQDYVETHYETLIELIYHGFTSAQYFTPHEGVKGKEVLTQMSLGDLGVRFTKQFNPREDQVAFAPRVLEVDAAKAEIEIFPQDFENSYLGRMRRKGQGNDIPFESQILSAYLRKLLKENDHAAWQGEPAAVPAAGDLLVNVVKGFNKIITDEQAAGSLTPFVLPAGGYTSDNIVTLFEEQLSELGEEVLNGDVQVFCSRAIKNLYIDGISKKYDKRKAEKTADGGVLIDKEDFVIRHLPGFGKNSQAVLMSATGNLHYGYDDPNDMQMFKFMQQIRSVQMAIDWKIGYQIAIARDEFIQANDQF